MGKENRKYWLLSGFVIFIVYFFTASQPVPVETILVPRWLSSLESNYPVNLQANPPAAPDVESAGTEAFIPFELGGRFGYVNDEGRFVINRIKRGYASVSDEYWAEYKPIPAAIEIRDPQNRELLSIESGKGYPFFLDGRIFFINAEQNSLQAAGPDGKIAWTYDFASPLTDIDAAAGLVLTGSLDGTVELLNTEGQRIFFFEPGGSRLMAIYGCRISSDGSRLAIISGYDDQRFLLLERFGDSYKVIYHEFLNDGFNWAVHIAFIDHDSRVAFERQGGLGIYDINARESLYLELPGNISALESYGGDNLLFLINSLDERQKELVAVRLPGTIILKAPFKSENVFMRRQGSRLYVGGGGILSSFEISKR
ncbi:MAG: WD40 repeat domain-containing protein [Treponema sp.]|jgi:hypothetical protein|nr:WD40 repeat domain-containing protein [Treponema sp.]